MSTAVRIPAVAGRFYPGSASLLRREVESLSSTESATIPGLGCVSPHAGYMYSGSVAGAVYSRLDIPERAIILCPNHTGMGAPLAMMTFEEWQTPLGTVATDRDLGIALSARLPLLHEDSAAHRDEHAIEVQLPFLQVRRPDLTFLPIAIGTSDFDTLQQLGHAIADVISTHRERVLIVASSDMNHYEPDAITRVKDQKAIDEVLALNPLGLWNVVMKEDISMCGFGSTVVMLTAVKRLGASSATLVKYATSGDVSGDRRKVVGYAGIIVQ